MRCGSKRCTCVSTSTPFGRAAALRPAAPTNKARRERTLYMRTVYSIQKLSHGGKITIRLFQMRHVRAAVKHHQLRAGREAPVLGRALWRRLVVAAAGV